MKHDSWLETLNFFTVALASTLPVLASGCDRKKQEDFQSLSRFSRSIQESDMAPQDFVDRSNTNWTPWPRLAKVMSHNAQVVLGVGMIMGAAGLMMMWRRKVGKLLCYNGFSRVASWLMH